MRVDVVLAESNSNKWARWDKDGMDDCLHDLDTFTISCLLVCTYGACTL